MGIPISNHRPLRAGIAIMPSDGEDHRGTLTGVARKPDGNKVLVTNLHIITGTHIFSQSL